MNTKTQPRIQDQENLRKIFQNIHEAFKSDQLSSSLEKKLSPFKRVIQKTKTHKSPMKFGSEVLKRRNNNDDFITIANH